MLSPEELPRELCFCGFTYQTLSPDKNVVILVESVIYIINDNPLECGLCTTEVDRVSDSYHGGHVFESWSEPALANGDPTIMRKAG